MTVLGIDVGGHSIKAGIITKTGKIKEIDGIILEHNESRKQVVSDIAKIAKGLLDKDKSITSIGIGIPGIVDKKGFITYTPNLPLSNFHLGKALKSKLKKRMVFGNDADCFAIAKHMFGVGKGYKTIICLTLGTGVGSGLIINGKLFSNNGAPELGHTTIKFDGPEAKCCKNDGCIETYIGRKSFPEGPLTAYEKALAGNEDALKRFDDYGKYLGIALSNFINIFNPEIIILGGQLSNAYSLFKKTLDIEIKKRALFKTRIIKNDMRDAGTIGAAILAF